MSEMRTVRGMRDLMGTEMRVRNYLIGIAVEVFELFSYEPLDSPVLELWETLSAKGGEEIEAETFKFTDKGEREVGLRFDLTVPLARIAASNPHLQRPFKRYAIGKAWRYDRPQAGRYREFEQADVDIVGSESPAADAEVVLVALEFLRRLFGKDYLIRVNSRKVLKGLIESAGVEEDLAFECFRAMDKLDKIGKDGVREELAQRGISSDASDFLIDAIAIKGSGQAALDRFRALMSDSKVGLEGAAELELMSEIFEEAGVQEFIQFDMSLARGFDYYTGPVFEGRYLGEPDVGSILGGGRYDHLISRFGGQPTPATGISLGIGRIIDIVLAISDIEKLVPSLDVFIAPVKKPMLPPAMAIMNRLVRAGVSCEIDVMDRSLGKLFELAENRRAAFMLIVGKRDYSKGEVSLRDMKSKDTVQVKADKTVEEVKARVHPETDL
jgi:histidyl-tRNA synthetase